MHYVPLLLQAQPADLGDRVEDPPPVNDLPVQGVRYKKKVWKMSTLFIFFEGFPK